MLKAYFRTKKPVFNFFFCTSSSFGLLLFVFLCNVEWSTIKYASFKSTLRNSLNYRQTKSCIHYKLQFNSYVANLLGRFNGFIHIFSPFCFLVNKRCVFTMEFRMLRLFFFLFFNILSINFASQNNLFRFLFVIFSAFCCYFS